MYIDVKIFEDSGSPPAATLDQTGLSGAGRGDLLNVIPSHKISSPRPRTGNRGIAAAALQKNSVMSRARRNLLLCLIRFKVFKIKIAIFQNAIAQADEEGKVRK